MKKYIAILISILILASCSFLDDDRVKGEDTLSDYDLKVDSEGFSSWQKRYNKNRSELYCTDLEVCKYLFHWALIANIENSKYLKRTKNAVLHIETDSEANAVNVQLHESSGDSDYDKALLNSVKRASPFVELSSLDKKTYDSYFRCISIEFSLGKISYETHNK